jgi:hypothetical protein
MKIKPSSFFIGLGVFSGLLFLCGILAGIPLAYFWILHDLCGLNVYLSAWILWTLYGLSIAGRSLAESSKKRL